MIKTECLLPELFDNSRDLALVTDEKFNIRYISANVETIFGLKPFSLLGKNAFEFAPPDKREEWLRCLQDNWKSRSSEITLNNHAGEEVHFDLRITNHVSHDAIRGIVIILHDVTRRKNAQRELLKTNDHLDHFIFKTIHDLQAPLHSSLGLVGLAESSTGEERTRYITMIRAALEKLDGFIVEMNQFLRNEKLAVQHEHVDVDKVFNEELATLRNMPGAHQMNIDFSLVKEAGLFTDPLRLKTILTNILSNSIKYRDKYKDTQFVKVAAEVTDKEFRIRIEDNGIGIEDKHLPRIFDMYFRANTQLKGTGLGLYIVKDTIERLNGRISVKSELGVGTLFEIVIPNQAVGEPQLN